MVLSKLAKKDIERFWLLRQGTLITWNNKVENLQHGLWDITRLIDLPWTWKIMTTYAWTEHFKSRFSNNWGSKALKFILGQLIIVGYLGETFMEKKCINSIPLVIIFRHLFDCPKANLGPLCWQRVILDYFMLIIMLYLIWWKWNLIVGLCLKAQPSP